MLVNIGKGGFGRPTTYRTESTARDLAIGDLNGDRKEDLVSANTDEEPATLSVLLNATGLCGVPHVRGRPLPAARLAIARAGCRVGGVRRGYSATVRLGRVISETPRPGTVLRKGAKVNLVVSRGRKR